MKLKSIQRSLFLLITACLAIAAAYLSVVTTVRAEGRAQIPTVAIPTVTGTPVGAIAFVLDSELGYANVRAGPSTYDYEIVGVLTEGSQVPAIGRSPGGQWIQIIYPGVPGGVAWVNADLVEVRGTLPIVEAPPTSTPRVTATIDPTLAAQFLVEVQPTRLPTFTAPGPILMPTYTEEPQTSVAGRVPTGLVIVVLVTLGIFGLFISLLRGR